MSERGIGSKQIGMMKTAQQKILKVLEDGEWHRYQDIQKFSSLSTATLSKHLKELEKGIVERKVDSESREYPPPVCYRIRTIEITPEGKEYRNLVQVLLKNAQIHTKIKRPTDFIRYLNAKMNFQIISNLEAYFYLNQNEEWFQQATEYFVVSVYRQAIEEFKEELKELAAKGENIQNLLSTTLWQLAEEFADAHTKKISPELRKSALQLMEKFKSRREGVES